MDHFLLPKDKGHIRIPNLTSEDYTRGDGGFEGYPARSGWTAEHVEGKDSFGGHSTAEIAAFFQSWLYFGCAIEVLATSNVAAQPSDLLDADKKFVSTRRLPFLIRQWRRRVGQMKGKNHPVIIEWATKAALILRKVSDFVDTYCLPYHGPRSTSEMQKSRNATSPLPEKVWMSIIALGHTLGEAVIRYYDIRRTANHWGASTLLKRRMLRKGWCPMDVERSLTDMGIDGHYYIAKKKNSEANRSHKVCTKDQCLAGNIDEETYKQKHVREECTCSGMKVVDTALLIEIIERDRIPVFRWDSVDKKLSIASSHMVQRGVSYPAYIAISHVWSDGMGNPSGNSLLECRLQQVQELVNSAAFSADLKGSPRHFWLDTFCVPVGKSQKMKDLRLLCIRRMASIYKGAAAVLVLSSTIRKVSTADGDAERGLAFYLANWNSRLWTFQEGMLAEKLLLQFSDKVLTYDELSFPQTGTSIARGHCVTFPGRAFGGTMDGFNSLRDFLRDGLFESLGPREGRRGPLALTVDAVQFRSTTKRSDETICVGTLMRLQIKRLQDVEETIREEYRRRGLQLAKIPDHELAERRMELFWSMVRVFPREIIFNTHRRLTKDGFGWAPASLLGIPRRGFARHVEGSSAIFDKERCCLSFNGPGIVVQVPMDDDAFSHPCTGYLIAEVPRDGRESLKLRIDTTQTEDHSSGFPWIPGTCYGIILSQSIDKNMKEFSKAKNLDWVPINGPELEEWFEMLYPNTESAQLAVDAAIGSIQHGHLEDYKEVNPIQIRHKCLGNVTLLNPLAIVKPEEEVDPLAIVGAERDSDSDWETENEASSDSEVHSYSDDCEGLDMSEDYEARSDPRDQSEDSQRSSDDNMSTDEPNAEFLNDVTDDFVTDDSDWNEYPDSDSELGGTYLPVPNSNSSEFAEGNQAFGDAVSGTLRRGNTRWFIF